ncbi:uncharacterized protein LOC114726643 isoform X1 [Neltuma alba]|uniref:uncharacterized protein LOC114726643 isoform X1 n=1 Tax=Neltuma alba TaxID=207710 RepID=UPI0010A2DF88|nr:uncharacterized protein LOC114726643 isoform X1 [Prosopis alba]
MHFMAEAPPFADLLLSLEQATFMLKQLPSASDQTHLLQICTSLHSAHRNLSNFLSTIDFPPPPRPPAEHSFSSASGVNQDANGNEPMEVGDDDDEAEANVEISRGTIEKVEEKMRDCFIKNKRPKRPLSPSTAAAAEERRLSEDGLVGRVKDFDAHAMRLRALDLVYQFHG